MRAAFLAIRERPAPLRPALAIAAATLLLLPCLRRARYASCRELTTYPCFPPFALTMHTGYPGEDPTMPSNPTPRPGDHVELTIRGVYRERDNNDSVLPHLIETHAGAMQWIPDGDLRVVDPPEPTTVGTVVTGWATPDVTYPETMFVYVRTGTDDGSACWQAPGSAYEYEWPAVLADTLHSRRIIAPPDGAA